MGGFGKRECEETEVSHGMPKSDNRRKNDRTTVLTARRLSLAAGAVGLAGFVTFFSNGCTETDSWLWNPSVVGRWEDTPTIVPVLERIDVIENDTGDFVEITQVTRDDLLPVANEVRLKPGDALKINILDFPEAGQSGEFTRVVDAVGFIDLPLLPRIKAAGMPGPRVQAAIEKALVDARIMDRPVVQVELGSQEESTFRVFGTVEKPGQFRIPGPDYRLLQGITDAGGVSPIIKKIYVIRQVSLTDELEGTGTPSSPSRPTGDSGTTKPSSHPDAVLVTPPPAPSGDAGEDLLKVIDDLTAEPKPATPPATTPAPTPAPETPKPGALNSNEHDSLMGALSNDEPRSTKAPGARRPAAVLPHTAPSMSALQDGGQPMIDLPEADTASSVDTAPAVATNAGTSVSGGQWVFLNGEWVRVFRKSPTGGSGLPEGKDPLSGRSTGVEDILTQRVIEIPVGPLLQGAAQYNLVIRPGDIINVPGPEQGFVYAEGPGISRIGVYSLPQAGQLTIQRLVAAAGGLSEIAVPERVDITRRVGDKRQATVRLNLRAIYEGTQPDIVLKTDDLVNFGTNFWATPMAIIRNGFRMTYGFGFLADRNFGSDIFGVPPEARARGFGR
jgi:protein involved in polysaccharide export with SLBB domain